MEFGATKKDKRNFEIYDTRMYLFTKYSYKNYWVTILHIIMIRGGLKEKKIKNVDKIFAIKKVPVFVLYYTRTQRY